MADTTSNVNVSKALKELHCAICRVFLSFCLFRLTIKSLKSKWYIVSNLLQSIYCVFKYSIHFGMYNKVC